MKSIKSFRDLLVEVDMIRMRMEDLEREDYSVSRIQRNQIDLERYIDRKYKINNEMAILQSVLEDKERTIEEIKTHIDRFEGIEYKIAYKRFVECKTLSEIAKELSISESWARKKSAKISKRIENKKRQTKIVNKE